MIPAQITTEEAVELARLVFEDAERQRREWAEADARAMACSDCREKDAKIVQLMQDAFVGETCRELLMERGCTSDERVVHVPTLVAEFLNRKDAQIERLQSLVRELRAGWFLANIYSQAHQREWENEARERLRDEQNRLAREHYDADTEALLRGEQRCLLPECQADYWPETTKG